MADLADQSNSEILCGMFGLSHEEFSVLKKLSTPNKIQDYLDALPINHEKGGDTCLSPRRVLREQKAHCIEGAMLAATALWIAGEEPLLLDLKSGPGDYDHVVALFKTNGYWGALSKTNHAVLRFRDPIYRTVRELALSYFSEYFKSDTGKKTLQSYSRPFNLTSQGENWVTSEEQLWDIATNLDYSPHFQIVPKENKRHIRNVTIFEQRATDVTEWLETDPRT